MADLNVNSIGDASGGNTATINSYKQLFEYKDGVLYWKKARSNVQAGAPAGSMSGSGYTIVSIKKKRILAHRIIYAMLHNDMPAQIDHINGDRSDNRIENLRKASQFENNWNRAASKNNKIAVKNVCWATREGRWLVQVMANGKKVVQKMFDDFELAELVAIEARDKYHGSFAYKAV